MAELELRADCTRCRALCCVALPFTRSADFAFDKAAGTPCRHLDGTRCGIHAGLRESGFPGCVAYDCFGAGQRVTREYPDDPAAAFHAMTQLHELLWYLREALSWRAARPVHQELKRAEDETHHLAAHAAHNPDVGTHRAALAPLLRRASELVRGPDAPDHSGADLAGRDLRDTDLRRTSLRGALLIGADLRGADLTRTDLLGADLRGADVRGANLETALFLTRAQLGATHHDLRTRIPESLQAVPR